MAIHITEGKKKGISKPLPKKKKKKNQKPNLRQKSEDLKIEDLGSGTAAEQPCSRSKGRTVHLTPLATTSPPQQSAPPKGPKPGNILSLSHI